jgi:hypothetical protein
MAMGSSNSGAPVPLEKDSQLPQPSSNNPESIQPDIQLESHQIELSNLYNGNEPSGDANIENTESANLNTHLIDSTSQNFMPPSTDQNTKDILVTVSTRK